MNIALICFGNEESYGLLFVGSAVRNLGHTIRFFDAETTNVVEPITAWQPDYAFFSPMTTFFPQAYRIAATVKKVLPQVVIIFGGHHATSLPTIANDPVIDVAVVGPVSGTLEQLFTGKRGIIRGTLTAPADLPRPARKEYYRDIPRMASRYRKVMLSMLGCPWDCSYCSSASGHLRELFGATDHCTHYLQRRPLKAVMQEAHDIIQFLTAEIEWVDDDIFCGKNAEEWLLPFIEAWDTEIKLPLYVSTTSVSVLKVSDKLLRALRRIVNCVGMGVQAIRPASLKLLGRSWDSEEKMKAAYDRLTSFGFRVNLQCIVGLPVEDPVEDALETITGMQRIGTGSIASCYPLQIYPGTALERYVQKNNLPLNPACTGDTNTGIPAIDFGAEHNKQIRNICKLATPFVKYGIDEHWMRALIAIELDEEASKNLSIARYYECVTDRLGEKGKEIFNTIMSGMNLRY